ncbi:hypothetical protein DMTZ50_1118 [Dehalococcoides mccartyi]|nr:hypothetical protein [Dehalococcoides mccartyi]
MFGEEQKYFKGFLISGTGYLLLNKGLTLRLNMICMIILRVI